MLLWTAFFRPPAVFEVLEVRVGVFEESESRLQIGVQPEGRPKLWQKPVLARLRGACRQRTPRITS